MPVSGKFSLLVLAVTVCTVAGIITSQRKNQREVPDPQGIYQAVTAQFLSVRGADYIQAYDRTSRTFQVHFDLDEFQRLTRPYLPIIAKAERMEFGTFQRAGQNIRLRVYLIDREGHATACLYTLVPEAGQWKIEGIEILREWPKGSRLTGLRV